MSPDIVSDNMIINVGGRTDIVNYYPRFRARERRDAVRGEIGRAHV